MASSVPVKKLVKTALYTSVILIGAMAIAPHAIIIKSFSLPAFFKGMLFLTLFILFIWLINISLIYLTEKYGRGKFPDHLRYLLSYVICLPYILLVKLMIKPLILDADKATGHLYAIFVLGFILNTIVLIIQDLILLREKKTRVELENADLKIKNVEATNRQLKQQIHPHFLFNSLNTLKTLIRKHPDKAEDYLVKLSDFLRASLLSSTPNVVRLNEEMKLCNDYLEMQKMRFGDALRYTINIPEEVRNSVFVPVFSLLPLLENAIKHNKLTDELPLHIQMEYTDGRIITANNMQPKSAPEPSTGLGLENLNERYKILSGDEIVINNNGKTFSVSVKTLVNENSHYRR